MAQQKSFCYDIVFCLDKTLKNASQLDFLVIFIEKFKERLATLLRDQYKLQSVRIKIIEYDDFNTNDNAIIDHDFVSIPEQYNELMDLLESLEFAEPVKYEGFSSGLEALAHAINSKWKKFEDGRQAIVLFSLNKPLSLEESRNLDNYPKGLPENLFQLKELWDKGSMDKDKKMLTLFCNMEKDKSSWFPVSQWDKTIAIDTEDINDYDSDFIMETLLIDII